MDPAHDTTPSSDSLRVHSWRALTPGPRLIVLGAVHGNETCGTRAITHVMSELDSGALVLQRGSVSFVPVTNPLAYRKQQRMGERNLNRNLYPNTAPQDYEDGIANVLCPLLAEHDVLLDLHSFHTAGEPFVMVGPPDNSGTLEPFAHAAAEQALALRLGPRRIVEGWLETYAEGVKRRVERTPAGERAHLLSTDPRYGVGTTEYMRSRGGYGVTLECGQHDDPNAPQVGYRAIRRCLAHLRMVDEAAPAATADIELLRLTQVVDKHHAADHFARAWASYDRVGQTELIGTRDDGSAVLAPHDGYIVFPNPAAIAGNEWFYFARRSTRDLGA